MKNSCGSLLGSQGQGEGGSSPGGRKRSRLVSLSRKKASLNILKNVLKIPQKTHFYKHLRPVPYFGSRVTLLLLQSLARSHS